jgi:hypothetical protein
MDIMQYNEEVTKEAGLEEEQMPVEEDLDDKRGHCTDGSW